MLVQYRNKLYRINTVIDPYKAHVKLELMCSEKEQVMKTMGKVTFEEFIGRLQAVQKEFPDDVEVVLNRGANRMVRALKANSPNSGKDHKGKLNKSWKKKIEGYGKNIHADIYSTAPHFHLVDRGHKIIDKKGAKKALYRENIFCKKP